MQYGTTYGLITGPDRLVKSNSQLDEITAKKVSIELGRGNQYGFTTTNQRSFAPHDPSQAYQQPNKDFIHNIRASHFEYGDPRLKSAKPPTSETKVSYNYKGSACSIRSKLDTQKKNDLRNNHFAIGGPTANFKNTTVNVSYRPGTTAERVNSRP